MLPGAWSVLFIAGQGERREGGDLCQQDGYLDQAALPGGARLTLV